MSEKTTPIQLASQEAHAWRELAAACGLSRCAGNAGEGEVDSVAEAIRRVGQAYQRAPEQVAALLRPLLLESGTGLPPQHNGDQMGVELEPVGALEAEEAEAPILYLPGARIPGGGARLVPDARTPGGETRLVVLEFEVFQSEQGPRARPLSFRARFAHQPEGMIWSGQQYLIRYDPAGKAVLRDWGFLPLDRITIIGPGASGGISEVYQRLYQTSGQWGYYWVAPGESVPVESVGEPICYPRLPRQMLAYLQSLIPTIRTMDIFCEKCHGWQVYHENLSPYWCKHIWWCERCQRITSPEVRARKWFGSSQCAHSSPRASRRR